jgi:hypothetical protein
MRAIGEVANRYGRGEGELPTRQNVTLSKRKRRTTKSKASDTFKTRRRLGARAWDAPFPHRGKSVIDREARSGSTEPVRNHDSECSTLTVLPRCSPPTVRREQAVEFHTLTKSFSTAGSARRIRPRQSRRRRGTDEAEVVPRPREFRLYLRARHLTAAVGDGRRIARGGLVAGRVLAQPVWRVLSVIRHAAVPASRSSSCSCSCSLVVSDPLLGRPDSRRGGR